MLDALTLVRELVALPGPPGQEALVREAVAAHARALGYACAADAKGNLIVGAAQDPIAAAAGARIVVTAHLDEIALMVVEIAEDGALRVAPLGGLYPWKWGEQPVRVLASAGPITGIVSFGSVHTEAPESSAQQARTGPLTWAHAYVFTGLPRAELARAGARPGTRVVLAPERRTVTEFGPYLASYFLDDRADLAAWLLALQELRSRSLPEGVVFAATAAEEVGGEGARYLLHALRPETTVALEIGPSVPECCFVPDERPTVWVRDSFSATSADDLDAIANVAADLGFEPRWQALSRGGSDASCAAAAGITARPITFGLAVENSHGCEIMHRDAPARLADLLVAYLRRMAG
ncbi:MAG: M20/M25/M40 family metallo-hydrolase [Chthonomonadales bacterium]|nr:M20/M25/M40 family metallo-hydrolase [Chthonomonadales bacterium]